MESFNELNQEDKLAWLELFESQDISAKEFCSSNELNYHQFLSWKRSQNPSSADFVELDCTSTPSTTPNLLAELDLGDGIVLRIFNPNLNKA